MWTGSYVFDVILGFFIWQDTGSFRSLVIYKTGWGLGVLVGVIIAQIILQKVLSARIRVVSILIGAAFALSLLFIDSIESSTTLLLLGVVYGFKVGLGALPYNIIYQAQITPDSRSLYSSMTNAIYKGLMIFFPLIVTQIIDKTENYAVVFVIGFILNVISIFPLLISTKYAKIEPKRPLDLAGTIKEIKESKNLQGLLKLKLLNGIYMGFTMTVFAVLGLYILEDIGNWGIVSTIITIFSIVLYYTISRKISFSKAPILFTASAAFFAVIGTIFAANLNLGTYIIFLVAIAIKEAINDRSYYEVESKIIDRRVEDHEHLDEFLFIQEIPLFVGRMIPLGFFLITDTDFEDSGGLSLVILLVTFIPLAMTMVMDRIALVKRFRDPFIYS